MSERPAWPECGYHTGLGLKPHCYMNMFLYSIYATSNPTPTPPTKEFLETGSCSVAHAGPEFANQTNEDLKVTVSSCFCFPDAGVPGVCNGPDFLFFSRAGTEPLAFAC